MASNLPVLRRGRRGEIVAKAAEEQAFQKAVAGVAKSFLAGNAAQMPGLSSVGGASNAMLARVTQDLAASFNRTPSDVELALAEQGLSWGPPFPPGRPLDPFWGHRRPARTWDYSVGENVQVTPRWGRISFPTLKAIIEAYDVAQICIRHLTNDVRSLDYQFVPPNNIAEDATEDVEAAERFFATPDKRQPFRAWLAEWLQDVLRYDAGSLYIRRNEAGDPIALEVVNGTTIIPIIDFYGRIAADEDDTIAEAGGLWPGDTVPAYVQIIQGMPFNWLAAEDIIYQPWNPMPDSQYGLAPMEAVLLSANTDIRFQFHFLQYFTEGTIPQGFMEAPPDMSDPAQVEEWQTCYTEGHEVLTSRGWLPFAALDIDNDFIFTRNPKTKQGEWQQATRYVETEYAGDVVNFAGRSFDLQVTPNHWMLVSSLPRGCEGQAWGPGEWLVRADALAEHASGATTVPATSEWEGAELAEFRLPWGESYKTISGDDFAAFMGAFLSEGSVTDDRHATVGIAQRMHSKGFEPFRELLTRILGHSPSYNGQEFSLYSVRLARYLRPLGKSYEKYVPGELKALSPRQLRIFWHYYWLGDGCVGRGCQTIATTSARMAGDLQEIAQKMGYSASVSPMAMGTNARHQCWRVNLRTTKHQTFRTSSEAYNGKVYCVEVPNHVFYVRRNGKPAWCGNTWDALMVGDQSKLRQIRWVPAGAKYEAIKDTKFDSAFPLYLMRRVAASFGVTPNDLGFTEDINRSTGDTQIDVQFRVGTLPLVRHVEDIINLFITEHLKLKARIQFDIGREVEDRLATAQAEEVYIRMGVLSPDEVRQRLGKRTSRERPTPRFIDNTRSGPIPVLALDSLGGKVDPSTFGPAKDQPNLDHPFVSVPGVAPVISSTEYGASQNATANMQRNMLVQNEDDSAPGVQVYGDGRVQTEPGLPVPAPTADPKPDDKKDPKATKALTDALSIIDILLDQVEKVGAWDNTGGPGVTRGPENPVSLGALEDDEDEDEDAEKEVTAGITVATGIEGSGLIGATDDGDEDDEEKVHKAIRQWRDNTRNRIRKNLPPKRFVDPSLPAQVADAIWGRLQGAGSREQVDAIFKDWRTLADPTVLVHKRALELLQPDIDRLVASAARVDTAREALIAQRTE